MGSSQKIDRPKPWRARNRSPDGRQHSKSFQTLGVDVDVVSSRALLPKDQDVLEEAIGL